MLLPFCHIFSSPFLKEEQQRFAGEAEVPRVRISIPSFSSSCPAVNLALPQAFPGVI